MRDMSFARQITGPTLEMTSMASQRVAVMVGPFLVAYVTEGGWAGVFRNLVCAAGSCAD